jgi:fucose permease
VVERFTRDRLTWVAYVVIAWYAYLQAAPGLVVTHLRDELDLSHLVGGLHVAAFAAGSVVAGAAAARLERALGRRALLWSAAAVMGAGAAGLATARLAPATVGGTFVMGLGGGVVLVTVQALLADRHGERRAIAIAEANVAASAAYVALIGALSLTAALHAGWRIALLASLVVPAVAWWSNRRLAIDAPGPLTDTTNNDEGGPDRLPRAFRVAAVLLFCTTAAEWCVAAWGASFVEDAADTSADAAVALMAGYFGGVLAGRVVVSRLARHRDPAALLALALVVAAVGFAVLWPASTRGQAVAGLALLGLGVGNLFPMGLAVAVALAPRQSAAASGRAVVVTSAAVLIVPPVVGAVADATSLTAALAVVPVALGVAGAALAVVRRRT